MTKKYAHVHIDEHSIIYTCMEALVCTPYLHNKYSVYVSPYSWTNVHSTHVSIYQYMNISIYTKYMHYIQSNYIHIIILTFLI